MTLFCALRAALHFGEIGSNETSQRNVANIRHQRRSLRYAPSLYGYAESRHLLDANTTHRPHGKFTSTTKATQRAPSNLRPQLRKAHGSRDAHNAGAIIRFAWARRRRDRHHGARRNAKTSCLSTHDVACFPLLRWRERAMLAFARGAGQRVASSKSTAFPLMPESDQ